MTDTLSMDARVLLTAWFTNGHKTKVEVGGAAAKSRLTHRAFLAMNELITAGYVTAEQVNASGRMLYQGTLKRGQKLTLADMERHGAWSPTEPNPNASEENKGKSLASIRLSAGGRTTLAGQNGPEVGNG